MDCRVQRTQKPSGDSEDRFGATNRCSWREAKLKRLEPLRKWVLEANQAQNAVISDNWLEMKSFLQKVGSNRLLRAQTLTVSFKKPFDSLAETIVAVAIRDDRFERCSRWWRRRELNPRPKQPTSRDYMLIPGNFFCYAMASGLESHCLVRMVRSRLTTRGLRCQPCLLLRSFTVAGVQWRTSWRLGREG